MLDKDGETGKSNKRRVKVKKERGRETEEKNVKRWTYLGQHGHMHM